MRVATPDIDITGVVPTLRGVFKEIDRARGEGVALIDKIGRAVGSIDDTIGNEGESLEGAARAERTRARSGVVYEVSALQMETAGADVADLQRSILTKAFFEISVPLLDVLSGRVRVKRGEADGGGGKSPSAQDGSTEIEAGVEESSWWSEVVGLLGFRKYIRDIVALIAPGVPIDRGKEDAVGTVEHEA